MDLIFGGRPVFLYTTGHSTVWTRKSTETVVTQIVQTTICYMLCMACMHCVFVCEFHGCIVNVFYFELFKPLAF